MPKKSAGILLYRRQAAIPEVFLVHPGGPFWAGKDAGAWSIPKGEFSEEEDPLAAARREFAEETGRSVSGHFLALTPIRQKGGKWILAWAIEGDFDPAALRSNTFSLEWPPRSGKEQSFPEVDKAAWFTVVAAREKINPAQGALVDELMELLNV